jgi:lipopolysaccharide export system protein LptA
MIRRLTFLTLLAGAANAHGAYAQGANPFAFSHREADKPIGISANSIVADVSNQAATYVGNVVVTQGDLKMRSDNLTIKAAKGEVSRIQAKGNVVFASRQGQASGAQADYDVLGRTVVMSGKVVLTQGLNVMRGTRLVINLNSGEAKLTGDGGVTGTGGRVEGIFVPAKSQNPKPKAPISPAPTQTPANPGPN